MEPEEIQQHVTTDKVTEQPPQDVEVASKEKENQVIADPVEKELTESPPLDDAADNHIASGNDSEYETMDSSDSSSEREEAAEESHHSRSNSGDRSNSESDADIILEREEGDGQESLPAKKVDDDEDKKNPQYIPKRGTFYEHDDRTNEEEDSQEASQEKLDIKKKSWLEKKEKWGHDKYNDNEQAPKSRSELISLYGYDIRNEDGPPRARRRRRYGRGPNKYTRNWEDEDAYRVLVKPVKALPKKLNNRNEEFPSLVSPKTDSPTQDEQSNSPSLQETNRTANADNSTPLSDSSSANNIVESTSPRPQIYSPPKRPINKIPQRVGTGRVKPKPETQEVVEPNYRGFTKSRQFRNSKNEQTVLPKRHEMSERGGGHSYNRSISHQIQDVEREMNKVNIQDPTLKNSTKHNNPRQTSVPPRLQGEQKGSKRYSSLRQRSLPETAAPPFNQHGNYYPNEYNQQSQSPPQQPSVIHSTTPPVPQIPPPPLPPIPQQVPVTAATILQPGPQFAASPYHPAPPFLPAPVAPPPFIAQQTPQIINYVQGQPQFPQAPYQGYQHQQFNPPAQPAELFQTQGITYYSTQSQQATQRAVPQKRPKAAIPIVPPPPQEPRGRGRNSYQNDPLLLGDGQDFINEALELSNNYEDANVM